MIFSKVCMFKDLEELQANGCQTDVCLVGAGGVKVSIHRAMLLLLANHVARGREGRVSWSTSEDILYFIKIFSGVGQY